MTISIAFASNEHYVQHLGCTIASILANAHNDESFCFYVLDGGITWESQEKLRTLVGKKAVELHFLKVDKRLVEDLPEIAYFSLNMYSRLLLPQLLPEVNRLLYLDCDMIVTTSLAELWNSDLQGCSLGVVQAAFEWDKNINEKRKEHLPIHAPMFNSGMLLIDLKKVREEGLFGKTLEWIRDTEILVWPDQDGLNVIFEKDRVLLPQKWNIDLCNLPNLSSDCIGEELFQLKKNPVGIIHYNSSQKPWNLDYVGMFPEYYWKYLKETPWKDYRPPFPPWKRYVSEFQESFAFMQGGFREFGRMQGVRFFGKKCGDQSWLFLRQIPRLFYKPWHAVVCMALSQVAVWGYVAFLLRGKWLFGEKKTSF